MCDPGEYGSWFQTTRTARRNHICYECNQDIKPGTRYEDCRQSPGAWSYVGKPTWERYRFHIGCLQLLRELFLLSDDDCMLLGGTSEYIDSAFPDWPEKSTRGHPYYVPFKLLRAWVQIDRWRKPELVNL